MSTNDHDDTDDIYTPRKTTDEAATFNINNKTQSQLRIAESDKNSSSYDRFSTTTNFTSPASQRHNDGTDGSETTSTTADRAATLNTITGTQLHFTISKSDN